MAQIFLNFGLVAETSYRHIVAARYCDLRVAKPPPFLGVSSLNLAALRSGHFFCPCAVLLSLGFVARAHVRRTLRTTLLPK